MSILPREFQENSSLIIQLVFPTENKSIQIVVDKRMSLKEILEQTDVKAKLESNGLFTPDAALVGKDRINMTQPIGEYCDYNKYRIYCFKEKKKSEMPLPSSSRINIILHSKVIREMTCNPGESIKQCMDRHDGIPKFLHRIYPMHGSPVLPTVPPIPFETVPTSDMNVYVDERCFKHHYMKMTVRGTSMFVAFPAWYTVNDLLLAFDMSKLRAQHTIMGTVEELPKELIVVDLDNGQYFDIELTRAARGGAGGGGGAGGLGGTRRQKRSGHRGSTRKHSTSKAKRSRRASTKREAEKSLSMAR